MRVAPSLVLSMLCVSLSLCLGACGKYGPPTRLPSQPPAAVPEADTQATDEDEEKRS